jgi:uncharacterized membrane protein YkvA (DUF1232 family)
MEDNNLQVKKEYSKTYSSKNFFEKIKKAAHKAGIQVIYAGLLLFYTLQKPMVPKWAKRIIIGALGYFIFPIDAIPDLLPAGGYVDDFGAIALALGAVAMFIDKDIKNKAKNKLAEWFGKYDESLTEKVDNRFEK